MIRIHLISEGTVVKQISSSVHEGIVLEQIKRYADPFDTIKIIEGKFSEDAHAMLDHVSKKIIPAAIAAGMAVGDHSARAKSAADNKKSANTAQLETTEDTLIPMPDEVEENPTVVYDQARPSRDGEHYILYGLDDKITRIPFMGTEFMDGDSQRLPHYITKSGAVYYVRHPHNEGLSESVEQGVAEGAPELLKAEMPLVRHIDKELAQHGYKKGTPEYDQMFKHSIAMYRKFGNVDAIKQGVAEGSDQHPGVPTSRDELYHHHLSAAKISKGRAKEHHLQQAEKYKPKQGVAEAGNDTVTFEVDSENAYNHIMKQFGSLISWGGDAMVAPRKHWGAIQELAYAAGGEATEVGDEQTVAERMAEACEDFFNQTQNLTELDASGHEKIAFSGNTFFMHDNYDVFEKFPSLKIVDTPEYDEEDVLEVIVTGPMADVLKVNDILKNAKDADEQYNGLIDPESGEPVDTDSADNLPGIDESVMSELDDEIGQMMDKYIEKYRAGQFDPDHLLAVIAKAATIIATKHGIGQNEAQEMISSYVEERASGLDDLANGNYKAGSPTWVDEGMKEKLAAAALAGSMALGAGAAHAAPDQYQHQQSTQQTTSRTMSGITGDQMMAHPEYKKAIAKWGNTVTGRNLAMSIAKAAIMRDAAKRSQKNEGMKPIGTVGTIPSIPSSGVAGSTGSSPSVVAAPKFAATAKTTNATFNSQGQLELGDDNKLDPNAIKTLQQAGVEVAEDTLNEVDDKLQSILDKFAEDYDQFKAGSDITDNEDFFNALQDYYANSGQIITGDPAEWITDQLDKDSGMTAVAEDEYDDEPNDQSAADKNIIMQLRKASDYEKPCVIQLADGTTIKLNATIANKILDQFAKLKPESKELMQQALNTDTGFHSMLNYFNEREVTEAQQIDEISKHMKAFNEADVRVRNLMSSVFGNT